MSSSLCRKSSSPKAALDKARQIWSSVESFALGDAKILADFENHMKATLEAVSSHIVPFS